MNSFHLQKTICNLKLNNSSNKYYIKHNDHKSVIGDGNSLISNKSNKYYTKQNDYKS